MLKKTKNKVIYNSLLITLVSISFVLCACEETMIKEPPLDKGMVNIMQINMLNDISMENAIVAQRILYPYHFITNSEKLNELGHRDLAILIEHFKQYPGQLNLQQGDTPAYMYQDRVAYVSQQFENAGVDMTKVSIVDDFPGGPGMTTDDVVEIQQADQKARRDRRQKYPRMSERSNIQ